MITTITVIILAAILYWFCWAAMYWFMPYEISVQCSEGVHRVCRQFDCECECHLADEII